MAFARFFSYSLLMIAVSGCANTKAQFREVLDDVGGLDPDEQRKIVDTTRRVALSPQRHGADGLYVAGAGNATYLSGGGEIGYTANHYWCDYKAGLAVFGSAPAQGIFFGPTAAFHIQLPTRLTPFAGLGVFGGYMDTTISADNDGVDNDNNGWIDEYGEQKDQTDFFGTVYPEIGVHYWLTDYIRLSASSSYHITTEGRNYDFWMIGGSIAILGSFSK